jgi:hypothetical protein
MQEAQLVSHEEMFNVRATKEAITEASAYPTIPTDKYVLQFTKWEGKKYEDGRLIVRITATATKDGAKKGTLNFSVSPELKRTASGKPDKNFKLYAQLQSLTHPESKNGGDNPSVVEVLERALSFPIAAFVSETFKGDVDPVTGQSAWNDARTPEAAKEAREKGHKAYNFVQSLSKA